MGEEIRTLNTNFKSHFEKLERDKIESLQQVANMRIQHRIKHIIYNT
jgi:hypothetical protein